MFQELPEGQTHYENDGCGEPAHNKKKVTVCIRRSYPRGFRPNKEEREQFSSFAALAHQRAMERGLVPKPTIPPDEPINILCSRCFREFRGEARMMYGDPVCQDCKEDAGELF